MNPESTFTAHAAHAAGSAGGPHAAVTEVTAEYVAYLQNTLQAHKEMLARSEAALTMIHASRAWKLVTRCCRLRDRLLPPSSRRRRTVQAVFGSAMKLIRLGRRGVQKALAGPRDNQYRSWIEKYEPGTAELARQRSTRFERRIKISIVTPTYETPVEFLKALLESVRGQTYDNWELCVADGGSRRPDVREVLEEESRRDPRIKAVFLAHNQGIAGNSAAALALAGGDFVTFLDHDDTLAPFALFEVARAVNADPDADVLYSDEDMIDVKDRRTLPQFKPDWSPEVLVCHNYICHLAVYRRELLDRVGGLRPGFDGAQDFDLVLRATEQARKIVHIPKVLYHWRFHAGSSAGDVSAKMYAVEAGRKALQEHLNRRGVAGAVTNGPFLCTYRTTYALAARPLVSILIATRDQAAVLARCLDSLARSSYNPYEILLVENNSREPETFAYYRRLEGRPEVRLLLWDRPFNYAAVNNYAASQAKGEVLLFLNNDVEVINADWLERLLEHALRLEIGAVGAKLYYPDGKLQHGGMILGVGAVGAHVHLGTARGEAGYGNRLVSNQNYSAVTGACLMTRRCVFEEAGGFDEDFALAFNDTDLCLRIRQRGYRIVWTPWAELFHHESATRGHDNTPEKKAQFHDAASRFLVKWSDWLRRGDPYYNPNLSTETPFSLRA